MQTIEPLDFEREEVAVDSSSTPEFSENIRCHSFKYSLPGGTEQPLPTLQTTQSNVP